MNESNTFVNIDEASNQRPFESETPVDGYQDGHLDPNFETENSDLFEGEDEIEERNRLVFDSRSNPERTHDSVAKEPEENEDVLPVGDLDQDPGSPVDLDHPEKTPTGRHPLPGDYGYDKAIKDPDAPNPFFKEVENPDGIDPVDPSEPVEPKDPDVPVTKGGNGVGVSSDGIGADFPKKDSTSPPLPD